MDYRTYSRYSMILGLSILLVLALLSLQIHARFDMSRDKAFSITEYTRSVLEGMSDQLTITYYLSDRLENRVPAIGEISDLLDEYRRLGGGRITISIVDPEDDPDASPEDIGIAPRELQVVENNEQTFALVYSGIALSYRDSLEVIPIIVDSAGLEYELTSRILRLTGAEVPALSVLIGRLDRDQSAYATLLQYLGQYYRIEVLTGGDVIPPLSDALLVLGGADLGDGDLYQIEQQMLAGKGVLFAVDTAEVDLQQNLQSRDLGDRPVFPFLEHHGFRIDRSWILDESNQDIPVQQQQGRVLVNTYQEYPQWPVILSRNVDGEHPITARFEGLDLFWASPVFPQAIRGPAAEPGYRVIARSSENSSLTSTFATDPAASAPLAAESERREGSFPVAVAYTGPLEAYYAAPPPELANTSFSPPLAASPESRLVVIGDADFPSELFQVNNAVYNILFAQTLTEYLSGDEDLLTMRTRGRRDTRLDRIADPAARNAYIAMTEFVSLVLIPGSIVLFAAIRAVLRRRRALRYRDADGAAGTPAVKGAEDD
jgi:ABC-type uncharacterized transport system involved in gliding motility auxiliary subunit